MAKTQRTSNISPGGTAASDSPIQMLLLTDLENQHAYVESLAKDGDRGFALIAASAFVQGMRDSGYRSTATAIDEFVDNSYQSEATRIDVLYATDGSKNVNSIAIVDNGHGMEPGMIRAAVLWGGTHRFNDRTGFGRYGFGLPSAAVSITEEYEVYSKIKDGAWHRVRINLLEIASGKLTNSEGLILAPKPEVVELPKFVQQALGDRELVSGTVIHLVAPDRLTSGFRKGQGFEQKMLEHLGLVYRGLLRQSRLYVNEKLVEPVDPLFLDPNARFYDIGNGHKAEAQPPTDFRVTNRHGVEGSVRLRFSYMHPHFQKDTAGKLGKARFGIMKENNGYLIVTRAGRQIDLVAQPHYSRESENLTIVNYDRNWAVELDFDPVLDEEFGITVNKQQVTLTESMWQKLSDEKLPSVITGLRSRTKKEIDDLKEPEDNPKAPPRTSEQVMKEAAKFSTRAKPKPSQERQEEAREKLEPEVEKKAREENVSQEEALQTILVEQQSRPFVFAFESLEGAPFYRVEQYGIQTRVWINRRHRFYTDIYAPLERDARVRSAIELLIFVLAACELEAREDRELFYRAERSEWSRQLETTLALLDRHQSIDDARSAQSEDEEILAAAEAPEKE
jgi:hypothetical protein